MCGSNPKGNFYSLWQATAGGWCAMLERDWFHARKASNYIVMMETHTSVVCVYCQNLQLIGARADSSISQFTTLGRGEKICWPWLLLQKRRVSGHSIKIYGYLYVEWAAHIALGNDAAARHDRASRNAAAAAWHKVERKRVHSCWRTLSELEWAAPKVTLTHTQQIQITLSSIFLYGQ
jgi:hypothetical protein